MKGSLIATIGLAIVARAQEIDLEQSYNKLDNTCFYETKEFYGKIPDDKKLLSSDLDKLTESGAIDPVSLEWKPS